MNKFSKIILSFLALLFFGMFFYSFETLAQNSSALAAKICDIRQLFCGGGGLAVIVFAIGTMGFLVLQARLHWSVLVMVGAGFIIFLAADQFVNNLTGDSGAVDDNCQCL